MVFGISVGALAQEVTEIEGIRVFGGARERVEQPTAPQTVGKQSLEKARPTDVTRALNQAPGVYVREEEGLGLRPNIGLRGTNPDRSKKIVLMEDSVLIGPAPYSAPAAYYTPSMSHTDSLEIYKGFTAVPYGPNSIGGAINYLSRGLSDEYRYQVEGMGGSFGTYKLRATAGAPTDWGYVLLNVSRLQSEGFKELDGGGDTGFFQNDVLLKTQVNLPSSNSRLHNLGIKVGYANEDSHETYLGTTLSDFNSKPYRRYRASALDEMKWEHFTAQIDHNLQVSELGLLKTTLYRHTFYRSWYKFDQFRGGSAPKPKDLLLNPSKANYQQFLEVLKGEADTASLGTDAEIKLFDNHREYFNQGLQALYNNEISTGSLKHVLSVGARLHQDGIERNHSFDLYEMTNGELVRTTTDRQNDKRNKETAFAKTLAVQDDIHWGPWVFTLLARHENVKFELDDLNKPAENKTRKDSVTVGGLGVLRKFGNHFSARGSVNRAATLAGLDLAEDENREEAINYEFSLQYFKDSYSPQFDLVFFYNDYSNLTGTCSTSNSCNSNQLDAQFNGGKAQVAGLEARYAQAFSIGKVWFPFQFNTTILDATFQNAFNSQNPEWGSGDIEVGDPLPYVPSVQYSLSIGTEYKKWGQEATFTYHGEMYDQSVAADRKKIPAYGIVDWITHYRFSKMSEVFLKVDNLLGREYIVAARPFGYRPGKPTSVFLGFSWAFE